MKKTLMLFFISSLAISGVMAQEEEESEKKGFKKENLFTGGSVTVSFFNRQTVLGANPMFGYKLTNWLDAGIAFNFLYNGARDYSQFNDKIRQTVWGPGAFMRLYPANFLFIQGQFEHNFSKLKYIYPNNGLPSEIYKTSANSLLLGAGIAQGRERGSTTFYYISVLFDVLKNINSPYVNVTYNPDNPSEKRVDMAPIIRAGMNIGLFQGRYGDR